MAITAQATVYQTFSAGCDAAKSKFNAPFAEWKPFAIRMLMRNHSSKRQNTEKRRCSTGTVEPNEIRRGEHREAAHHVDSDSE